MNTLTKILKIASATIVTVCGIGGILIVCTDDSSAKALQIVVILAFVVSSITIIANYPSKYQQPAPKKDPEVDDIPVGTVFSYHGKNMKVVNSANCLNCCLQNGCEWCNPPKVNDTYNTVTYKCLASLREDWTAVKFIKQ